MNTYITRRAYVDYYSDPVTTTPSGNFGTASYKFHGDGKPTSGRLKIKEINLQVDVWVDERDLMELTPDELVPDFPPLKTLDFYESCVSAANIVNNLPGIGSMNAEYLLLLSWMESGWTNSDAHGREGPDADLTGPVGPFRFSAETWNAILGQADFADVTRGYGGFDRYRPNVQPLFAGAFATELQSVLRKRLGVIDPAAWLLRLGHRIGSEQLVRFVRLDYESSIDRIIDGKPALDDATIALWPGLFPRQGNTKKSEVHEFIRSEFDGARTAVVAQLGNLLDELRLSILTSINDEFRTGVNGFLDFIGKYEAAGNYNAIFGVPGNQSNPPLTNMTIAEVLEFQKTREYSASGKYQIILATLSDNYGPAGLSVDDLFDEAGQDAIAKHLLLTRCRGDAFLRSARAHNDFHDFALKVAKMWAALPVLRETVGATGRTVQRGQSYYADYGPNKAQVSADLYEAALAKLMAETEEYQ